RNQEKLVFVGRSFYSEAGVVAPQIECSDQFHQRLARDHTEFYSGMASLQPNAPVLLYYSVRLYGRRQRPRRHAAQLPPAGANGRPMESSFRATPFFGASDRRSGQGLRHWRGGL